MEWLIWRAEPIRHGGFVRTKNQNMKSEQMIFGKGLTPESREAAGEAFDKLSEEGFERVDGEVEKSEEASRFIGAVNGYLNEELRLMGVGEIQLDPRRIHILSIDDFEKNFPNAEANGIYRDLADGIYVRQAGRMQLYKTIFHEMVHQASSRSFFADPKDRNIGRRRIGYTAFNSGEKNHEHFRGLNEAVTDMIVREIFIKHKDELIRDFEITEDEQKQSVDFYFEYMDVVKIIIAGIAKKNGEDEEAVWERFKKGEFTGEMMHLRDIEKTFGKGSLRVLAAMDSGTKNIDSDTDEKLSAYFKTEDEKSKDAIAKDILIERERLRYNQSKIQKKKKTRFMSFFGFLFGK